MSEAYAADASARWAAAIRQRRKALMQRLGMGTAAALVFSPLLGWTFGVLWLLGYVAVQFLDLLIFEPIYSGKTNRMGRVRTFIGCAMLFANATFFGSLSIPLWILGGALGGVCAALLITAGAIYSTINAPGSRLVLFCAAAPQLFYLSSMPFFMAAFGADPTYITAVTIAVGVFGMFCLQTWKRMNDAAEAEAGARLEAERKRAEAERAMASRSAFLAAVGHDLRTPISAILTGAAEMERMGDGPSRANAQLITDAGMMMKAMLDDLLDHSKLDAGRMTVDSVDFDLRQLFAQTIKLWQAPARAKGLQLRFEGAAQTPDCVRGDPMRLRQVLNNLISNAMKFTAEGSITLRVRAWTDPLNDYSMVIDVVDTGPGMTPEQVGRLFTPFDQTAEGISARHGGTGLGLAISRDLAQLMGGRLTARSAPGQGACFTLSLNLGRADAAAVMATGDLDQGRAAVARALSLAPVRTPHASVAPVPAPDPAPVEEAPFAEAVETAEDEDAGRPLRILVVDDHEINRRAIQLILQPMGCDIATAADGLQALEVAAASPFDVIFMDVRMPELDGRETTRRLRAGAGMNAATPVIAVTADTAPEDIAACSAAGMNFFVSKPLTPAALLGALTQVLASAEEEGEAETVAA